MANFNVGSFYTTRDGRVARCIAIDSMNNAGPIIMMIDDRSLDRDGKKNGRIFHVMPNGMFHRNGQSHKYDIMSDYVDAPQPLDMNGYVNIYKKNGQMKYYFHATYSQAMANRDCGCIRAGVPVSVLEQ